MIWSISFSTPSKREMAEAWPPRSPMKALLSSPSGRKKYREYQDIGHASASPARLLGSPSLLEKLRAARADRDHEILEPTQRQTEDDEEDEETLRLKLQAIEAKLKLKKLQQQKAKDQENFKPRTAESAITQPRMEVALSPTKRPITPSLPKSPSRVLLGIDKGVSAADVSLRRAKTINGSPTRKRVHHVESQATRPASGAAWALGRPSATVAAPVKSFSERMADMRDKENGREQRSSAVRDARCSHFKLDKTEMERYHAATDQQQGTSQPVPEASSMKASTAPAAPAPRTIKQSRSMPSLRSKSPKKSSRAQLPTSATSSNLTENKKGDPTLFEGFSGTHLSSRILPHTFLKRTLPSDEFTVYTIPKLLKDVHSPDYQIPDEVTNYVVFGTIANMSNPRNHKAKQSETNTVSSAEWEKKWKDGSVNRQKFMVVTLTDLKWTVELFLFDNAVPRYHRLAPGTLIAILNPGIMPPKKGREDTGHFSLTLNDGEDQILEIGKAKHLGYCKAVKKDGHNCGSWVDASKTEICEYHLNAQVNRTRGSRAGINKMDALWKDQRKEKPPQNRRGFDSESQSFYYAVGGTAPKKSKEEMWSFAPTHNPNISTAKLLDMHNPSDPFLAEGQMLERDKQDRLRKRMAAMQKEHEIAKKLGSYTGSAGGQYMRQRTDEPKAKTEAERIPVTSGIGITKEDIVRDLPGGASKKRAADSVRLSPVKKKTRFLTEKGIREAGRESLGPSSSAAVCSNAKARDVALDDDDDDLDII